MSLTNSTRPLGNILLVLNLNSLPSVPRGNGIGLIVCSMFQVNNVYHHPSLGVEINLVVMKILVVDDSTVSFLSGFDKGKQKS